MYFSSNPLPFFLIFFYCYFISSFSFISYFFHTSSFFHSFSFSPRHQSLFTSLFDFLSLSFLYFLLLIQRLSFFSPSFYPSLIPSRSICYLILSFLLPSLFLLYSGYLLYFGHFLYFRYFLYFRHLLYSEHFLYTGDILYSGLFFTPDIFFTWDILFTPDILFNPEIFFTPGIRLFYLPLFSS